VKNKEFEEGKKKPPLKEADRAERTKGGKELGNATPRLHLAHITLDIRGEGVKTKGLPSPSDQPPATARWRAEQKPRGKGRAPRWRHVTWDRGAGRGEGGTGKAGATAPLKMLGAMGKRKKDPGRRNDAAKVQGKGRSMQGVCQAHGSKGKRRTWRILKKNREKRGGRLPAAPSRVGVDRRMSATQKRKAREDLKTATGPPWPGRRGGRNKGMDR